MTRMAPLLRWRKWGNVSAPSPPTFYYRRGTLPPHGDSSWWWSKGYEPADPRCVHWASEGLRPLDPPHGDMAPRRPVQNPRSMRPASGRVRAGPDGTAVRERDAAGSDVTPPSDSSSRAERGSFARATALRGDEPAAGANSCTCGRTQAFGPRTDRRGHKTHGRRALPANPATPNTPASSTGQGESRNRRATGRRGGGTNRGRQEA